MLCLWHISVLSLTLQPANAQIHMRIRFVEGCKQDWCLNFCTDKQENLKQHIAFVAGIVDYFGIKSRPECNVDGKSSEVRHSPAKHTSLNNVFFLVLLYDELKSWRFASREYSFNSLTSTDLYHGQDKRQGLRMFVQFVVIELLRYKRPIERRSLLKKTALKGLFNKSTLIGSGGHSEQRSSHTLSYLKGSPHMSSQASWLWVSGSERSLGMLSMEDTNPPPWLGRGIPPWTQKI